MKLPKLFHEYIKSRLSVREQPIRMRDSEGRATEGEMIYEELNDQYNTILFIVKDVVTPALMRWDEEDLASSEILRRHK